MQKIFKLIFPTVAAMTIALAGFCLAQETAGSAPADVSASQEIQQDEAVSAQDLEVKEPSLLPGSKLYFLKTWQQKLKLALTFNPVKKAELNLKLAAEKLLEAKKLAEKMKSPEIISKAAELYNQKVEAVRKNVEKFKENASTSQQVSKFLDKFTKQQILHEKILEKLENKVPTSTMEKIQQIRENHLEKFGEVMQKLEDKTQIKARVQNVIEKIQGSEFKDIKNLEILKRIEEKMPNELKEKVKEAVESTMEKVRDKIQVMPLETQQKVQNYLENVKGNVGKRLEIINDLKDKLPNIDIKQKLQNIQQKIQVATTTRKFGNDCVCTMEYNPVCGSDGKTYGNPCKASCLNVAIVKQGPCGGKATTTQDNKVPGNTGQTYNKENCDKNPAQFKRCESDQSCRRIWQVCPTSTTATQ